MKEGKREPVWLLMELSAEAWEAQRGWRGLSDLQLPGAPSGGSHHFLPLWKRESITPSPCLYLRSSEAQRQGFPPLPHHHARKVPLWTMDTAMLGGWGGCVTTWEEADQLSCADHKPTPGC